MPPSLLSEAREVSLSTYPLPVNSKVPQKTTTFERRAKWAPNKYPLLSWVKQEKLPFLHTPYRCIQKCHRKPPLLRGKQCDPCKVPPSLSSEAREVSFSTYPLPVHSKVPRKTTTFERRSKRTLFKCPPLSWAKREKFPFHIPLTSAFKSATENHHFWEVSKASPVKCPPSLLSEAREVSFSTYPLPVNSKVPQKTTTFERRAKWAPNKYPLLSWAKQEKLPFLHTPYRCIQKCHRKPPLLRGEQREPRSKRSFPFYIPLTGAHKCAKKTPLLRGERSGVFQMAVALYLSTAFQQSIWNFTFIS